MRYAEIVEAQLNVSSTGNKLARAIAGHSNRGDEHQTFVIYSADGPLDAPEFMAAGSVVNLNGCAVGSNVMR